MRHATIRTGLVAVAAAGLVTASGAVALVGAQEAYDSGGAQEEVRTATPGLGGYAIEGEAAPLAVRVFEPVSPSASFTDPGDPHAEANEAFSRANLSTGPDARALASSVWPGTLLGDGFGTITGEILGDPQDYPAEADARYPGGPETATGPSQGQLMRASAKGLDVVAQARSSESPSPNAVSYGSARSRAETTVVEDVAINRVDSAVSDVRLLEGLVSIDSVRTTLEARSDAATGATGGITEVTGLTIMGTGYTVDQGGLRPVEEESGGETLLDVPSTLPGAEELREQAGIEVRLVGHEETVDGAIAERAAGGLEIVVDSNKLRAVVDTLPLEEAISGLPEDLRSELAPVLRLSPRIVYVIAAGKVRAAASLPPEFDVSLGGSLGDTGSASGDTGPPAGTAGDAPTASGEMGSGSIPGGSSPDSVTAAPGGQTPAADVAPPAEPGSEPATLQAGGGLPETPGGLGGTVVLLGLAGAAAGSAGLRGLAAGLLGAGSDCSTGQPVGTPTWS